MPLVWMRAPGSRLASITATFRPRDAAVRAAASPAKLAPTIKRSNSMGRPPFVRMAKDTKRLRPNSVSVSRLRAWRSTGVMRSAVMRLRLLRSTWKRKPWKVKAWPGSGMMRASWMTRPATVVASSSGRSQSMARLRSRIGTEPSTLTEPSGCGRTPCTGDVVLVGDVADDLLEDVLERHQSLHLAILVDDQRDVRLALEEGVELVGEAGRVGDEPRLGGDRADVDLRHVAADVLDRLEQILGMDDADDVLRLVLPDRHAACRASPGSSSMTFSGGSAISTECMLVRWTMTSATSSSPKRKRLWMYSAWRLLHLAVLGRDLDQAFDLAVGQDLLVRRLAHAEQARESSCEAAVEQPVQRDRRAGRTAWSG